MFKKTLDNLSVKLEFTKMSGAGNDFVVIDNRSASIQDGTGFARRVCDRHWGVGADGLLLLEKSFTAQYKMMYYNGDGSFGGMCGNGGRCIAMFAFKKGIAGTKHEFESLDHIYSAAIEGDDVKLAMKKPSKLKIDQHVVVKKKRITFSSVNTGSPHIVVDIDQFAKQRLSLRTLDVPFWGKALRDNNKFEPEGTNVNFIQRATDGKIYLRTYERGVESETLACGTGSVASAIVASLKWKIKPPITIIPLSLVPLIINFYIKGKNISSLSLLGPAIVNFIGILDA